MSSIDRDERLVRARERATLARMRFTNSLDSTKRRLSFGRLKQDARIAVDDKIGEAREDIGQTIRQHPFLTFSAVAGLFAVIFWRPARSASVYGMRVAQLLWLNRRLWRQSDD